MSEIVSMVLTTSEVSAPIGMASGSITMSSSGDAEPAGRHVDDLAGQLEALARVLGDLLLVVGEAMTAAP